MLIFASRFHDFFFPVYYKLSAHCCCCSARYSTTVCSGVYESFFYKFLSALFFPIFIFAALSLSHSLSALTYIPVVARESCHRETRIYFLCDVGWQRTPHSFISHTQKMVSVCAFTFEMYTECVNGSW